MLFIGLGILSEIVREPLTIAFMLLAAFCATRYRRLAWFMGSAMVGFSLRAGLYRLYLEQEGFPFHLLMPALYGFATVALMAAAFVISLVVIAVVTRAWERLRH